LLREQPARTPEGGLHRRWFADEFFDLYLWSDDAGEIVRFQLCYGKPDAEHALTWSVSGVSHDRIDPGDDDPRKDRTPVLLPDGDVPWARVRARFSAESAQIPLAVRRLVLERLGARPAELADLREEAPARAGASGRVGARIALAEGRPWAAKKALAMRTRALTYFAFTFAWSCAFWAASVAWRGGVEPSSSPVFLLGGAGPFVAAVVLTQLREDAVTRRSFWLRAVDPRRIRGAWWAAALLLHPALVALAFAADVALGGSLPPMRPELGSASAALGLLFFTFWFGPLPEEIGWRGFALDRLQRGMAPLRASLVLGSVWALWHVPLFFVPGTFQEGLGFGSPRSWVFLASMIPLSVLMTWIYNATARSTLSAVLVHYSGNLCGALLPKTDRVAALELAALCIAAALVARGWGPRPEGRERS
jgi:membrane protease YdiL (CAAX protease family)